MSAIDEIEGQLLQSVAARARTSPAADGHLHPPANAPGPTRRFRRNRWPLPRGWRIGIILAAIALAGGGAAAAVLLDEHSAPLAARVPAGQQPGYAVAGGYRYRISLVPSLQVGQIGWCAAITTYSRTGQQQSLAGSCDDAPTAGAPLFAPQLGQGLSFVFTTPGVHAIQLPGHRPVLTITAAGLPFGYRAAVFEYLQRPGRAGSTTGGEQFGIAALDSTGRPIPYDRSGMPAEPVVSWGHTQAPRTGSCSVTAKPGAPLTFGVGSAVTAVIPAPHVVGGAFLPCLERDVHLNSSSMTTFPISERVMQIYVLLNAQDPTRSPPALPHMHALSGHSGVLNNASLPLPDALSNGMTAQRVGNAWLTVIGGRSTQQRLDVLDQIKLGPVRLATPRSIPIAPSHGCTLTYRPIGGMIATGQSTGSDAQLSYTVAHTCLDVNFYYQARWPLTAAVVLSKSTCQRLPYVTRCPAPRTSRRETQIRAVPGHPNDYTVSSAGAPTKTIQRLGRAWLIVSGGHGSGQQQLLMSRLSVHIAPTVARSLEPTQRP